MSISDDALDLLESGGATAKFPEVGTVHKGTLLSIDKRQARDFDTGVPKVWDDGNPIWELVVKIQTDTRDADIEGDDGVRTLYAGGNMLKALKDAFRKAGVKPAIGGTLAVKYTGDGEAKKRGFNPPKLYVAQYAPPVGGLDDLLAEPPARQAPKPSAKDLIDEEPF